MPTLWNTDHQPQVLSWQEPAVMPGEAHDFTDEQIAAGLPSCWSEKDPRAGLEAEKQFKAKRDRKVAEPPEETPENGDATAAEGAKASE